MIRTIRNGATICRHDARLTLRQDLPILLLSRTLLLLFALLLLPARAAADELRGIALVIGNSAYEHLAPLANPANDARAIEALLDGLGFETTLSSDRDARRLARDLRDFVEDAEEADVAILYYAGHGIEAGGENFLVPVDADFSALDAAGERLVPVSALLERLQATVPLAIIMLDACRDNPFPPGALVRLEAGADPVPMGEGGLGETRGARPLAAPSPTAPIESYGSVIAFAAEPGNVALDGAPGANSPYTAAVLRHLEAMAGEEFGTVMRMVAEEVYLRTSGAQRPWVNESLRRLLYFGAAPAAPEGAEGEILAERRQLLLSISTLPEPRRRQVEAVAGQGGVPMDALYAMLNALGQDVPEDPAELARLLEEQTRSVRELMSARETLASADAEVERLSALAREAVAEGALAAARRYLDEAKERVGELSSRLDDAEAMIRDRRIEYAELYAQSARTARLEGDFRAAARDFEAAFREVERWDAWRAWMYRYETAYALMQDGTRRGGMASFREALAHARATAAIQEAEAAPSERAMTHELLGRVLRHLGNRSADAGLLGEAAAELRAGLALLEEPVEDGLPGIWGEAYAEWSRLSQLLGEVLVSQAEIDGNAGLMREAAAVHERALALLSGLAVDHGLSDHRAALGDALASLAEIEPEGDAADRAIAAFRAAAEALNPAIDLLPWYRARRGLAGAIFEQARARHDLAGLEEARAIHQQTLDRMDRATDPHPWSTLQASLADVAFTIGNMSDDAAELETALAHYRLSGEEASYEDYPSDWSINSRNIALTLSRLAAVTGDASRLAEARALLATVIDRADRAARPLDWASAHALMATVERAIALAEDDVGLLRAVADRHRLVLQVRTAANSGADYANSQGNLGNVLFDIAARTADAAAYDAAVAAHRAALAATPRAVRPQAWAERMASIGNALYWKARLDDDPAALRAAADALGEAASALDAAAAPAVRSDAAKNRADALQRIGEAAEGIGALREAEAAWHLLLDAPALDDATRAAALGGLARTLHVIGYRVEGPDELLEAADRFAAHAAGAGTGIDLAWVHWSIGDALAKAVDRGADIALMRRAADAFAVAAETRRAAGNTTWIADAEMQAFALQRLGVERGDAPLLREARAVLADVVAARAAAGDADGSSIWARTALADAHLLIAAIENEPSGLRAAVPLYEALLPALEAEPDEQARIASNLAHALAASATDRAELLRAAGMARDVVAQREAEGEALLAAFARQSLCVALAGIAEHAADAEAGAEAAETCRRAVGGLEGQVKPFQMAPALAAAARADALLARLGAAPAAR